MLFQVDSIDAWPQMNSINLTDTSNLNETVTPLIENTDNTSKTFTVCINKCKNHFFSDDKMWDEEAKKKSTLIFLVDEI